jgi:hypothetical protein
MLLLMLLLLLLLPARMAHPAAAEWLNAIYCLIRSSFRDGILPNHLNQ